MKKCMNVWMKTIAMMGLVMMSVSFANAQTGNDPAWPISKDVQRVANKKALNDPNLGKSHIRAKSTDAGWVVSKGVHRGSGTAMAKGNVASKGYPAWAISKGVQQIGR
ncbi:hypothetical protein [Chryseolinea lacunae]|uniref:Uncharacterized protein n=1 Tax=Chryseolinea lacunae TaxID=2801331 RepID=A0ABS1KV37_9BACT|nr:hypothetical protein [Chryseolinea lacunae]MBL0743168.1 hypothetical protein [Chryseolinea lacunae]